MKKKFVNRSAVQSLWSYVKASLVAIPRCMQITFATEVAWRFIPASVFLFHADFLRCHPSWTKNLSNEKKFQESCPRGGTLRSCTILHFASARKWREFRITTWNYGMDVLGPRPHSTRSCLGKFVHSLMSSSWCFMSIFCVTKEVSFNDYLRHF